MQSAILQSVGTKLGKMVLTAAPEPTLARKLLKNIDQGHLAEDAPIRRGLKIRIKGGGVDVGEEGENVARHECHGSDKQGFSKMSHTVKYHGAGLREFPEALQGGGAG